MPRVVAVFQETWDVVQMTTWQPCGAIANPEAMFDTVAEDRHATIMC
jgi:hypothetical protein